MLGGKIFSKGKGAGDFPFPGETGLAEIPVNGTIYISEGIWVD